MIDTSGKASWRESPNGIELSGSRCSACGTVAFPPATACPRCRAGDMAEVTLGTIGSLYTYSVVRTPVPGFQTPYAIGYVDFPIGVRVFGQIEMPETELKLGTRMSVVISTIRTGSEGEAIKGYKFRPVESEEDSR